ncbi:hypothetical protein WMY93_001548 [Mugilogobius chulae]|uniref:Uncharacterized protein n=1 Tax=Mugilogobius chulae TaxID=88201 RepID=A0AAW0QDE7_9GOBI
MLLLLLLSVCFTSGLAQTMSFTSNPEMTTDNPFSSTIDPTSVHPTAEWNSLAFLHTEIESTQMLNETSLDLVLDKISSLIREIQPDAVFTLTVQPLTEV